MADDDLFTYMYYMLVSFKDVRYCYHVVIVDMLTLQDLY